MRFELNVMAVLLSVAMAQECLGVPPEPGTGLENFPRPAKENLTPENFAKLHVLIRPHEREWRHLRVHWLTDVVAARKKAAAEDKPLVICYTGGAGYNEPLGVC
jgi:hypothetical protein